MNVLVTFALEREFAPWRRLRHFKRDARGSQLTYCAEIDSVRVVVLPTGVGPPAWRAVGALSDRLDFDVCISSGLAGALKAGYRPGEILAARNVFLEQGGDTFAGDSKLLDLAHECGANIVERFHTARSVVVSAAGKAQLAEMADAVEMESGIVFHWASRQNRCRAARTIAIRAVSDAAEEGLPLALCRALTKDGRLSLWRLAREVARAPECCSAVRRFARQNYRAAETLALFLDNFLQALGKSGLQGTAASEGKTQ